MNSSDEIRVEQALIELLKTSGAWYDEELALIEIEPEVLAHVPEELAARLQILPLAKTTAGLKLATSSLDNVRDARRLQDLFGAVEVVITTPGNIASGINYHYQPKREYFLPTKKRLDSVDGDGDEEAQVDEDEESSLAQFVNNMIHHAVELNASDLHIAPAKKFSRVLFRVNGKLLNLSEEHRVRSINHTKVINRIKSMCSPQIDVSQTMVPLDGAFEYDYAEGTIDCRVNTMPDIKGQKAALRFHYSTSPLKTLENAGFNSDDLAAIRKLLDVPAGMFLVTGPTGSGKTTTLYACLMTYDPDVDNIITVEDPVEVKVDGFTQVQLRRADNEKVDLTFGKVLRAILRQDPDVILVGEIRDAETAKIAIEASQTGHKVFSTLHTKSSVATVQRMKMMNIDQTALLSEMVCVIAQRLIGTNCPNCIGPHELTEKEKSVLEPEEIAYLQTGTLLASRGCPRCHHSGMAGRTVAAEILTFDDEVRDFLAQSRGLKETKKYLREEKGFRSMWDKGIELVHAGKTTVKELSNTISSDDRR